MKLRDLLAHIPHIDTAGGDADIEITSLCHDSRSVEAGCLFFAVAGSAEDGRNYIADAVDKGAAAVVADDARFDFSSLNVSVPMLRVPSARTVESIAAERFYGASASLDWRVGITGTNGKTSVAWLTCHALAKKLGGSAFVGTLGMSSINSVGEIVLETPCSTTTPDPIARAAFLKECLAHGCRTMAMEVSSHALVQGRAAGINWDVAVFTNLSRDHLDYHPSEEAYAAAKEQLFFRELALSDRDSRSAVVNMDDSLGRSIARRLRSELPSIEVIEFGQSAKDVSLRQSEFSMHGTVVKLICRGRELEISSPLVGAYNADNIAAAAAVLLGCSVPELEIPELLEFAPCVPGRLERVGQGEIGVFVDYAHTPDALQKAQKSLLELCRGRLITVFGCGGDRDRGKRPEMGAEVAMSAQRAVVTTDNPRTEDPECIIDDILPGLRDLSGRDLIPFEVVVDRRRAIARALESARPGDIVLIAGKGHENYQEISGVRHPFSDVEECRKALQQIAVAGQG